MNRLNVKYHSSGGKQGAVKNFNATICSCHKDGENKGIGRGEGQKCGRVDKRKLAEKSCSWESWESEAEAKLAGNLLTPLNENEVEKPAREPEIFRNNP